MNTLLNPACMPKPLSLIPHKNGKITKEMQPYITRAFLKKHQLWFIDKYTEVTNHNNHASYAFRTKEGELYEIVYASDLVTIEDDMQLSMSFRICCNGFKYVVLSQWNEQESKE